MSAEAWAFYLYVIHERDRRPDVEHLQHRLVELDNAAAITSGKQRRRLLNRRRMVDHRLRNAAVVARTDWSKAETDFVHLLRSRPPPPNDAPDSYRTLRDAGVAPVPSRRHMSPTGRSGRRWFFPILGFWRLVD